ncbi:MAG: histidine phosphatase family protein [Salinarimonas sp.]|nr:histidine phosphatase family protein [Salinarimonas sp.]
MKRLILLRHAKSDWPAGVDDLERPLNPRGREAAPRMGRYLAEEGLLPDRAIVSPAQRTRETFELVAQALSDIAGEKLQMQVDPRIYEAPPEHLLQAVRETDDSVRTLLMVGHNPGTQELAQRLIGFGDRYAFSRLAQKYPTAGLTVLDFDIESWRDVMEREARLDRFVTPKGLDAAGGEG